MGKWLTVLGALCVSFPAWSNGWQDVEAIRSAVGDAEPMTEGLELEMPSLSEDGSAVPLTVRWADEQTPETYLESIRVFAPDNPNTEVVDFYLTPLTGRAEVGTRVRVNESQTLYAVGVTNTGDVYLAEADVRVTTGGCLITGDDDIPGFGTPRVAPPRDAVPGEPAEIRAMVGHPMETGLREGPSGNILPRRMIDTMTVEYGGDTVFQVIMYTAVSENPYFRFYLAPEASGEATIRWTEEDTGEQVEATARFDFQQSRQME